MEYDNLLAKAHKEENAFKRLLYVAAFGIA